MKTNQTRSEDSKGSMPCNLCGSASVGVLSLKDRKEYKGIKIPKKKHIYRDAKSALKRFQFFKDLIKTDITKRTFIRSIRKL